MLKIENLSIKVGGKDILRGINLEIKNAEVHALLGPNASGKSTLAQVIMGFPDYKITEGKINFKGEDITNLLIDERSKLGISLAFQHPPIIKGVTLSKLLEKISRQTTDIKEFSINPDILEREINVGFSGGERKLSEIIQIISLSPSFVIFDELDAGLDIERLERLALVIKDKLLDSNVSLLLITHRGDILRFIRPDVAHVMLDGEIVCSSKKREEVWNVIRRDGYERCKECKKRKLFSN
ncbi:MAG: ABC transporter ATP-binding protein [Candidatus Thermoplasmatota archaeon]|nr:ABC transporter ATP-binding protein [Candidatus Thermoplasmatota archaeon]